MVRNTLSFLISVLLLSSCTKDEVHAENSLIGDWKVTAIKSIYGSFSPTGFSPTETIEETGQLGSFSFAEETVEFSFTRNDTLFTGNGSWNVESEKVREGFFKNTEFNLIIDNHFLFDVMLGDGTKNSFKNASQVIFIEQPNNGFGVLIEMALEK